MGFGNNNGGGNPNHDEQGKFTTANGGNHSGNSISPEVEQYIKLKLFGR